MSMEVKKAYVKNSTWCNIFKSSPKYNWNPFSPLFPHSDAGKSRNYSFTFSLFLKLNRRESVGARKKQIWYGKWQSEKII